MDPNILSAVKSPLTLFSLAILVCNGTFVICAKVLKGQRVVQVLHSICSWALFCSLEASSCGCPAYLCNPAEVEHLHIP